jgi:hypothetical protein
MMYKQGKYLQKMYLAILVNVNYENTIHVHYFPKLRSLVVSFATHCYGHAGIRCSAVKHKSSNT